jgi:hypothetical protein
LRPLSFRKAVAKLQGAFEELAGRLPFPELGSDTGEPGPGENETRIELHGAAKVLEGSLVPPLPWVRTAPLFLLPDRL